MDVPLQISFVNLDRSDAVEARIHDGVAKLEQVYSHITHCRIAVEVPERHRNKGNLFAVSIEVGVPGTEIVVNRHKGDRHEHESIYVAIRDAFRAARRQLDDHARRRAGRIKHHEAPPHGRVVNLSAEEDYGFVGMPDGQEIYFHRNSVPGEEFDKLEVGSEVRISYVEGDSEKGPHATTVQRIGKHHIVE